MRLNHLDLTAYGHFSATRLTLPAPAAGAPDLHVVYGPNEAGKSTLLSAWLDLLFGFPNQTRYAFRHDMRALRVGAELRDSATGRVHALARIKGNQNTLLDAADDQPQPEHILTALLGGLDRASYGTMFSLNDQTLVEGSLSILQSKGDLGQLLFQGTAGLAELGTRLADLRTKADAWHSPRKRTTALAEHKKRLADLNAARRDVDLTLGAWRKLTDAVDQAQATHDSAQTAQRDLLTRHAAATRDLDALPLLARLRRTQAHLTSFPPLRDVPADWRAALPGWQTEDSALAALIPSANAALQQAQAALDRVQVDSTALPYLPQVDMLEQRFGSVSKELADLPKRDAELRATLDQMRAVAQRLGKQGVDPETLILPAPLVASLNDHMALAAALASQRASTDAEVTRATDALTRASAALPDGADQMAAMGPLADLLVQIRHADPVRAVADADGAVRQARAVVVGALAALAPWQGDADDLAAMDLPSADTLRALNATLAARQDDLRAALAQQQRLDQAVARARAGLGDADLPDPTDMRATRARRDDAWAAHKTALSPQSASAFEAAMRADDAQHARALMAARLFERAETLRADQAELARAAQHAEAAQAAVNAVQAQVAAHAARIAPDLAMGCADQIDWLGRRSAALAALSTLQQAHAQQQAASVALDAWQTALAALVPLQGTGGFAVHLAQAQARLQAARDSQQARAARDASQADLAARTLARDAVLAAQHDWTHAWQRLVAQAGWATQPLPDPVQMRAILTALGDLPPLAAKVAELRHRTQRITQDAESFARLLAQMAQGLGCDPDPDPLLLWPRLRDRLRRARDGADAQARLLDDLSRAQVQVAGLQVRRTALDTATAPVRAAFPDQSLAQIAETLAAFRERAEVQRRVDDLQADLLAQMGSDDLSAVEMRLDALDPDILRADVTALGSALDAQNLALQAAFAALVSAQRDRDSVGSDARAAALDEERQTLLLQITSEAQDYLSRQAAILAIDAALRRYRDTHRSSMMQRAGATFSVLTGGRYSGLGTRPEGGKELLIAQEQGGAAKVVDTLSKGTAFQLYLALRIAGYQELADQRPMVPFIADDIMESFDDRRAAAAFGLLAQMARRGQVIYLTHHAHLCAIARATCPDVQVHDLHQL